ncbi:MAG: ABC transporter ATP-binding protein [Synergistales bacterium]|nr:ABC transporter ATP-binding protein [Synergistales bacterium]
MIAIEHLSVTYRREGRSVAALQDVSLTLEPGEILAVVGESGSGKSTLLMAILGLLPPGTEAGGTVTVDDSEPMEAGSEAVTPLRWTRIALILQGSMHSFTPVITVGRQIAEAIRQHGCRRESRDVRQTVAELLEEVGLPGTMADRFPHELSGGQKQRAAVAMALACSPPYLLADEPTTALDVITQARVMHLLQTTVRERHSGLMLVTHDLALASGVAHRIAVLEGGSLVEVNRSCRIIKQPRKGPTRRLVAALRRLEEETE